MYKQRAPSHQSHRLPVQPSSSKPQVLGAHKLVKGFSLGQLLGKEANPYPKYLVFLGGRYVELSTESLPTGLLPPCGVFIQTYVLREKSKVLQPCTVYILKKKKKVLYVFITLIIVIKSLPFLICGLGNFCLFFLFGGFLCFLFFSGFKKKKQTNLAFSVCTAAGQNVKTLKF